MAYTRIKICGITRPEDAQVAVANGADAIGLVFYAKSPRAVDAARAAEIVAEVAPFVTVVALFVDASESEIAQVLASVPVDVIQFHGQESATYCEQFERPYLKAVRVKPGIDLGAAVAPYGRARGILLDSWQDGVPGGTGKTFDWQLASGRIARPMVLAGGLDSDNVGAAIAHLHPAGVDVSGGVESSPGIKCPRRIAEFVRAVRAVDLTDSGEK